MPRQDLLSLTSDDLATLSTRGMVNAASKDLETGITGTLSESPEGDLRVVWSDGKTSELPATATLRAGKCDCKFHGICRHLIRLVLLYQRQASQTSETPPPPSEPWDPGSISDNELGRHFRPQALKKLHNQFEAGVLAELVRGTRPVARFHMPVCTVRFLVPGDLRYTQCNCRQPDDPRTASPCEHVPLALWAFRQLKPERRAGVVTVGSASLTVDDDLLGDLDDTIREFLDQGISGVARAWKDRLARLEHLCREADLVWPAEILAELIQQQESYAAHDARFDPLRVAEQLGELVIRLDAIRTNTGELPQLLIRGSSSDRPTELGKGAFVGLGCGVRTGRKGVELLGYLYDTKGMGVVVISKEIAEQDRDDRQLRSFATLGRSFVAMKGTPFTEVGLGMVALEGGKRAPSHELLPGLARATISVQDRFNWEEIQAPVLVEEFGELEDRLGDLPPSALRPRRRAEDFHVLRTKGVEQARFDEATHNVQALVVDRTGRHALLEHPYTSRGRSGAEALLARLTSRKGDLLFVAGQVRRSLSGLVVNPVSLVWEEAGKRTALQPWVEQSADESQEQSREMAGPSADAMMNYIRQVQLDLGELCVLGLARTDVQVVKVWRELASLGRTVGFSRLAKSVESLADLLEQRAHTLRWDPRPAGDLTLQLLGLTRLARDVA